MLDVNKMPGEVIKKVKVTQMPTIQIYRGGEMVTEIIGAEESEKVIATLGLRLEEMQNA